MIHTKAYFKYWRAVYEFWGSKIIVLIFLLYGDAKDSWLAFEKFACISSVIKKRHLTIIFYI